MPEDQQTVVFTHGGGRFGNQLVNAANLLAFDHATDNINVVDLAITPYCHHLEGGRMPWTTCRGTDIGLRWRLLLDSLWRVTPDGWHRFDKVRSRTVHRLARWASGAQSLTTDLENYGTAYEPLNLTAETDRLQEVPLTLVGGWGIRCWSLLEASAGQIRDTLAVGEPHRTRAQRFVKTLRADHDLLVGVLVRQDDYRTWNDGEYFFESDRYERWLRQFAADRDESGVGFLIASDEPQDPTVFAGDGRTFATGTAVGDGHYLESFLELSLCDVVLTPPSTFSATAAFLGETPLVPLYDGVVGARWEYLNRPLLDSLTHPQMSDAVR